MLKEELKVYKARMKAFDDVKLELKKNVSVIQKQGEELLEMNKSAESEVEQLRIREEEAKKTQAGLLKEVEDLEEEGKKQFSENVDLRNKLEAFKLQNQRLKEEFRKSKAEILCLKAKEKSGKRKNEDPSML